MTRRRPAVGAVAAILLGLGAGPGMGDALALPLPAQPLPAQPLPAQPPPGRPPIADPGALPSGGTPAPPDATEQRTLCVETTPLIDPAEPPEQLRLVDFGAAWPFTRGSGQRIAVIDTGIAAHPRLPNLEAAGDYVAGGDGLDDCDGHGTLVAGLIAAAPIAGSGFSGGAPEATILSIRQSSSAFSAVGSPARDETGATSSGYGNVRTMASAVRHAADLGATVINISEVACAPAGIGLGDESLAAALRYAAVERDVVIVAAAGNVGGTSDCAEQNPPPDPAHPRADPWPRVTTFASPAYFDEWVLTVGSTDPTGAPSAFSLAGPWVDVAAPGTSVVSLNPRGTELTDGYRDSRGDAVPYAGTSFAAPLVAATAALVRARYPDMPAPEVIRRIVDTARAPAGGWNPMVGHGTVDPLAALTRDVAAPTDSTLPVTPPGESLLAESPESPAPDRRAAGAALIVAAVLALLTPAVVAAIPPGRSARDQPSPRERTAASGSPPS